MKQSEDLGNLVTPERRKPAPLPIIPSTSISSPLSKLYTPPPFLVDSWSIPEVLVDSWSIPSIPVHSQESLGSPGSFPPHSQFIPGPFPEQGGVGMGGEKGGGRVYEAEEGRRGRDGV
jgi:hypothetical protein